MGLPIYDNIDRLLKEKGMSRRQLALKAGINPSTISVAFVKRNTMFHPANLQKIADTLDVTPEELTSKPAATVIDQGLIDGRPTSFINPGKDHPFHVWTEDEISQEINSDLEKLNFIGKKTAMERVKELTLIDKYITDKQNSLDTDMSEE